MTAEDKLQFECVKWFRYQYPELKKLLFAVPNGGSRNQMEAHKLKMTGVVAGVSDLILLVQKYNCGIGAVCIEMKACKGKQTELQHEWELSAISHGNKYVICRSFDEFKAEIESYLNE